MKRQVLLPPLTEVGEGSLGRLPDLLAHLSIRRAFVIADPGLPSDILHQVAVVAGAVLAGEIVRGPESEPTTDAADHYSALARSADCDGIVAVGGGSVMDLGKAVSMLVRRPGSAADYQGLNLVSGAGLPVVCVPTTAGSGAEATKSAVLTNVDSQVKRGINATGVLPNAVILDPILILSLPRSPRVAALLDATTHALESYIGVSSWTFSEMAATGAFPYLGEHLRVDTDRLTLEQAEGALLGSFLAGTAICNSETGAVHALAYPLTEFHGIPHAYAVGALLPEVMIQQEDSCAPRLDAAVEIMGFPSREAFLHRVVNLRDQLEVKDRIREVVDNSEAFARVVKRAMTLQGALDNSPRRWKEVDAQEAYRRLMAS